MNPFFKFFLFALISFKANVNRNFADLVHLEIGAVKKERKNEMKRIKKEIDATNSKGYLNICFFAFCFEAFIYLKHPSLLKFLRKEDTKKRKWKILGKKFFRLIGTSINCKTPTVKEKLKLIYRALKLRTLLVVKALFSLIKCCTFSLVLIEEHHCNFQ